MVRLGSIAVTAAALFLSTVSAVSTTTCALFTAQDGSISFALSIPQDTNSTDLYFQISGPTDSAWLAIGMGSDKMKDALMFMVYDNSTGDGVTVSPRITDGHHEPSYTNISTEVRPHTRVYNGTYLVNVKCTGCRSWAGGSIDPTNTAAKFIFAAGPEGSLRSNSLSADIKRHDLYGSFTMDLTKAFGVGTDPDSTCDPSGTVQLSDKSDHDFSAAGHACIMILSFVGLMPVGVLILRVLNSPKWHGFNQALSLALALIGVALGIYAGTLYNRTRHFNSAHQIFGLFIIVALISQSILGFLHHRIYKQTLATTKLAPVHVWLGRGVILCGIINGFLGFPLALNPHYNYALIGLVLLVVIVATPFAFWRIKRNAIKRDGDPGMGGLGGGYQSQPWDLGGRGGGNASDVNLGQMNYPPQSFGHQELPPRY